VTQNGNGQKSLSRIVWWGLGIGAALFLGATGFFATSYFSAIKDDLVEVKGSLKDMVAWQMTVVKELAEMKATLNIKRE
jgi:hypothetical protein